MYRHFVLLCFCLLWSPRSSIISIFVIVVESIYNVLMSLHPLFSLYFVWSHSFSPFAFLGVCCPAFFQVIRITVSSISLIVNHDDALSFHASVLYGVSQWTFGCNRRDLQFMNASNECNFLYFLSLRHLPWCCLFLLYALKSCVWSSCCFCGGSQHLKMAFAVFWSVFVVWTMRPCNISIVLSLSLSLCRYSMAESVFVFVS